MAVWGEGVDTLLPRVDAVLLASSGENDQVSEPLQVDWQLLAKLVPERMELVNGTNPALYRTLGFPTEEELARIRRAAGGK